MQIQSLNDNIRTNLVFLSFGSQQTHTDGNCDPT